MKTSTLIKFLAILMLPIILACSCTDLTTVQPQPTHDAMAPIVDEAWCGFDFLYPTQGGVEFPATGTVDFLWSEQPGTATYDFVVAGPQGEMVFNNGTSRAFTLTMTDFPQAGIYKVGVRAMSVDHKVMCHIWLDFTKQAYAQAPLNVANYQAPACEMAWRSPTTEAGLFPSVGPVEFSWTVQTGAASYLLDFTMPNGNHGSMDPTSALSKTVFMEAFTPGGSYLATVKAFDLNQMFICEISLSFVKEAYPMAELPKPTAETDDEQGPLFVPMVILPTATPEPPR